MFLSILCVVLGAEFCWQIYLYCYYYYRKHYRLNKTKLFNESFEIAIPASSIDFYLTYTEIFGEKYYWKNNIKLNSTKTTPHIVFDVGANAGFFTTYLSHEAKLNNHPINIYAFEPIPDLYKILKYNVTQSLNNSNGLVSISPYNCGLSNRTSTSSFKYDPGFTIASSMYTNEIASILSQNSFKEIVRAFIHDFCFTYHVKRIIGKHILRLMNTPTIGNIFFALIFPFAAVFILHLIFTGFLHGTTVECKLDTLDNILRDSGLEISEENPIDFIKIDVEGAEEDVLSGLSNLQYCDQYVVEIHNVNNRINKLTQLFLQNGFTVTVQREDWKVHELMDIVTLFARKKTLHY
jgi:FkbM family methyltransferase